jgi:hypothetical protein
LAFHGGPGGLYDQLLDAPDLADAVFQVCLRTVTLPPQGGPDEGPVDGLPGHYWRRVVSRSEATAMTAGTFHQEDDSHAPWNYLVVYREATEAEARDAHCSNSAIFVVGVYYLGELSRRLQQLGLLETQ